MPVLVTHTFRRPSVRRARIERGGRGGSALYRAVARAAPQVDVPKGAIISDLPWHPNASLWFDHHASVHPREKFEGKFDPAAKVRRAWCSTITKTRGLTKSFPVWLTRRIR